MKWIQAQRGGILPWKDLQLGMPLAAGSYGAVYAGKLNGMPVAVKVVHSRSKAAMRAPLQALIEEAALMMSLRHPHILSSLGVVSDLDVNYGLVMERMACSLADLLADTAVSLSWEQPLLRIASEVASAVRYLHSLQILHRDLKPSNVLLGPQPLHVAKVCDMGASKETNNAFEASATMTMVGTPSYLAPEIARHERYDQSADVFAFGATLWHMASRSAPFKDAISERGLTQLDLMREMADGNLVLTITEGQWEHVTGACPATSLIQRCISLGVDDRPAFEEICAALHELQGDDAAEEEDAVAAEASDARAARQEVIAQQLSQVVFRPPPTSKSSVKFSPTLSSKVVQESGTVLSASSASIEDSGSYVHADVVGSERSRMRSLRMPGASEIRDSIKEMIAERGSRVSRKVREMRGSI